MKRILLAVLTIFMSASLLNSALPASAYASTPQEDCENYNFMGFRPWYAGLSKYENNECRIKTPGDKADSEISLPLFVWTAILNITVDLLTLGGLAATGFIIFGGFKYIMSNGEPAQIAAAKKILTSAIIGLLLVVLASVISATIINVLLTARG